ncbi:MAG TPA: histidine kinase dimerization/phospho-acceptor domain-containing protein [Ktedonobacterales bacterium]|nr:histidine kinase dimerization/phospho-acceptor domain-containing protein [Ktedonobacterales bacterium]
MMRQPIREEYERRPGFISRIAGTSSLLQPYVPGRRPTADSHARGPALRNRNARATTDEAATRKLAALLERLTGAPGLDDALQLLAADLPPILHLARVAITLFTPHIAVDSQSASSTDAPQETPVSRMCAHRTLWLLPRRPVAAVTILELPIEASGERLGLLRAWTSPEDARSPEEAHALLRILCIALGQQVLLHHARGADAVEPNEGHAALMPDEGERWSAFLGQVAHEVKTPLTCIQGHTQLLSRYVRATRAATTAKHGILARLLDDCERHLPALQTQVKRIEYLLRDMLDAAQSDGGSLVLVRTRVDLVSLISLVARRLEVEVSRKIAIDAPAAVWVMCDAMRIEQTLHELIYYVLRGDGQERDIRVRISEAVKGGERVASIAVEYAQARELVAPAHHMTNTIFGTASAATPRDFRLALSAAILGQHGGSLHLQPDDAGGNEIMLTLPILEMYPDSAQTGELHGPSDRTFG